MCYHISHRFHKNSISIIAVYKQRKALCLPGKHMAIKTSNKILPKSLIKNK